ncbi:MAG: PLP-dependent aminotransferase family protein, partial [Myxococcales bacterium]|nr:PLP-dependent aminotransferase family protein [Myxococcales bacterium]
MAGWELELELDESASAPLYVRLADALRRDIARGRLEADARLPGARTLAARLGIHRNTVTAAYDELEQQGWLRTEPARARFVIPVGRQRDLGERGSVPRVATYALGDPPPAPRPAPSAELDLSGGLPDPRLYPALTLGRAYRRGLARSRWLDYGPPEGNPRLRRALAQMLSATRGLAARAEDVLVTRGSQHALWLVGRALLRPGDHVAVESYGYRPAWQALRAMGATVHPVRVDAEGIDVAQLGALCVRERV